MFVELFRWGQGQKAELSLQLTLYWACLFCLVALIGVTLIPSVRVEAVHIQMESGFDIAWTDLELREI